MHTPEKQRLAQSCRKNIEAKSAFWLSRHSIKAAQNLFRLPEWKTADVILAFASMEKEIQTSLILQTARRQTKRIGLPRIEGNAIVFYQTGFPTDILFKNKYRIPEPGPECFPVFLHNCSVLLLVPGLCFNLKGERLGRGRGYYDRFIAAAKTPLCKIGLCFDFQITETIPTEAHDRTMDYVITESAAWRCAKT